MTVEELPVPPAHEEDSDRDSDPAFVSPMDEVKCVEQQAAVTTANLHEASRWVGPLALPPLPPGSVGAPRECCGAERAFVMLAQK